MYSLAQKTYITRFPRSLYLLRVSNGKMYGVLVTVISAILDFLILLKVHAIQSYIFVLAIIVRVF